MTVVRVQVGELHDAGVDVVVRAARTDGASITPAGRRLELAAGPSVARQLGSLGEIPLGGAVLTPGGSLPVPYLLHLVVQSSEEPVSRANVRRALEQGLARAADWGLRSLALPSLGVGVGALEAEEAARLLAEVLATHPATGDGGLDEVVVVVENDYQRDIFDRALAPLRPSD
jgi:O-acetyl-ADP-ribose deacetylase (regulator of RNase III)